MHHVRSCSELVMIIIRTVVFLYCRYVCRLCGTGLVPYNIFLYFLIKLCELLGLELLEGMESLPLRDLHLKTTNSEVLLYTTNQPHPLPHQDRTFWHITNTTANNDL